MLIEKCCKCGALCGACEFVPTETVGKFTCKKCAGVEKDEGRRTRKK